MNKVGEIIAAEGKRPALHAAKACARSHFRSR